MRRDISQTASTAQGQVWNNFALRQAAIADRVRLSPEIGSAKPSKTPNPVSVRGSPQVSDGLWSFHLVLNQFQWDPR